MNLPSTPWFWICVGTILCFAFRWRKLIEQGWVLPALGVLATGAAWYLGDVIYNDYASYAVLITPEAVQAAWSQVWWFFVAFGLVVGPISRRLNRSRLQNGSQLVKLLRTRLYETPEFQKRIDQIVPGVCVVWALLTLVALWRVEWDVQGLLAPYLGRRVDPWARQRLGGGFDSLLSLAGYLQLFCASAIAALFTVARRPRTRILAGAVTLLALPFFVFHPRRNVILTAVVPPVLGWAFVRCRGPWWKRVALALPFVLAIHTWLGFVIEHRSKSSIAQAFVEEDVLESDDDAAAARHKGLNMFEELTWINYLMGTGALPKNWGLRYVAEVTNPIPRALWAGKPTIGLDYAVARGYGLVGADGGVAATISTGMIGQGVTSFGGILGAATSALLMSLWVALLARFDLTPRNPAALVFYLMGGILTFNLGRDINLLNIYPLLFGYLVLGILGRLTGSPKRQKSVRDSPPRRSAFATRDPRRRGLGGKHAGSDANPYRGRI